LNNNISS